MSGFVKDTVIGSALVWLGADALAGRTRRQLDALHASYGAAKGLSTAEAAQALADMPEARENVMAGLLARIRAWRQAKRERQERAARRQVWLQ